MITEMALDVKEEISLKRIVAFSCHRSNRKRVVVVVVGLQMLAQASIK